MYVSRKLVFLIKTTRLSEPTVTEKCALIVVKLVIPLTHAIENMVFLLVSILLTLRLTKFIMLFYLMKFFLSIAIKNKNKEAFA